MTVTDGGYTKHYYAESERVNSRLGGGFQYAPVAMGQALTQIYGESYAELALAMRHHLRMDVQAVGYDSTQTTFPNAFRSLDRLTGNNAETEKFYYHPDHIGSSSMITDKNGLVCQHLQYLPFGEQFVEQRTTATYYTPYKFSAKEKDAETGYSYFGARYYDADLSLWISADPMSDQRSWISPYNYCQWNPVMRTDPTGALDGIFVDEYGNKIGDDGIKDEKVYVIKTTQTAPNVNKNENPETTFAGISKTDRNETISFITANSGNTSAFQANDIAYRNSVEVVGDAAIRQGMVDEVNKDNGKGSSTAPSNNREFGGNISNGAIIPATPSAVGNVREKGGELSIYLLGNSPSFHSHASGTYTPMTDFNSYGGSVETKFWYQSPSPKDINNAGSFTNYCFGRGNGTVYIYNSQGVQATIPQKYFVTPKK